MLYLCYTWLKFQQISVNQPVSAMGGSIGSNWLDKSRSKDWKRQADNSQLSSDCSQIFWHPFVQQLSEYNCCQRNFFHPYSFVWMGDMGINWFLLFCSFVTTSYVLRLSPGFSFVCHSDRRFQAMPKALRSCHGVNHMTCHVPSKSIYTRAGDNVCSNNDPDNP